MLATGAAANILIPDEHQQSGLSIATTNAPTEQRFICYSAVRSLRDGDARLKGVCLAQLDFACYLSRKLLHFK